MRRLLNLVQPLPFGQVMVAGMLISLLFEHPVQAEAPRPIKVDGAFDDWREVKSYPDPAGDAHDTDGAWRSYQPEQLQHPDVDLVEYKLAHDEQSLYAYFRSSGVIGRTQKEDELEEKRAGRFHATIAIDVDNNQNTGYWIHRGGYYPTSGGYDVNAEVEWYDGMFNAGQYMNHCVNNRDELRQAFRDQSAGKFESRRDGPYPAGFMRLGPGSYRYYTQWAFHDDGTVTFTEDKGPVVPGIITVGLAEDGRQLELGIPMKGFLVDEKGTPIIRLGQTIDVSFSLEASGELAPDPKHRWASDTGEAIDGYVLEPVKP